MQSVNTIAQQAAVHPATRNPSQVAPPPGTPAAQTPPAPDRVEISFAAAEAAAATVEDGAAQAGRISALRAEIDAGSYVTDEKLDVVVDRLWAELRGGERE